MALASVKRKRRQSRSVVLASRIFCESRESRHLVLGNWVCFLLLLLSLCLFIFLNKWIYLYIYINTHTHKTALQQTRWQYPPTGKVSCWAHSLHGLCGQDSSSSVEKGQVTASPCEVDDVSQGGADWETFRASCLPLVVVAERIDVRSCNTVARPCKNEWKTLKSNNNNNKRAGV